MARTVDITGRIKTEEVFLCCGDQSYKLNDNMNVILPLMQKVDEGGDDMLNSMQVILETVLGKKAYTELTKDLSFAGYQALFASVMAEVTQQDYDTVMEQSFRGRKVS